MKEAIKKDLQLHEISGIVEANLLWFDTSSFKNRVYYLNIIFKSAYQQLINKLNNDPQLESLFPFKNSYKIIEVKNTSSDTKRKLDVIIVVDLAEKIVSIEYLTSLIKKCIEKILRNKVKRKNIYGEIGIRKKATYLTIRIYQKEKRIRELESNWMNKELILIAEWSTNWNLQPAFYTRDISHYNDRNLRIRVNPNLVKEKD